MLDPHAPYLLRRWQEGCHNGMPLWREIQTQGFAHGASNVGRFVARIRRDQAAGRPFHRPSGSMQVRSARHVAALFLRRPGDLAAEQRAFLERLQHVDPTAATTYRLAQAFAAMVREREGTRLEAWLREAAACDVPGPRRFAASLHTDLDAVRAGLTMHWSNGMTEGFVNKLKLVKRQGYGRAGFALLRRRLVRAA